MFKTRVKILEEEVAYLRKQNSELLDRLMAFSSVPFHNYNSKDIKPVEQTPPHPDIAAMFSEFVSVKEEDVN